MTFVTYLSNVDDVIVYVCFLYCTCTHIGSCSTRRPKSKKRAAVSQKRLPMDELSAITEVSESGHSTHTTFRSSSGGEEGDTAEEPVARKRWVESGVGNRVGVEMCGVSHVVK